MPRCRQLPSEDLVRSLCSSCLLRRGRTVQPFKVLYEPVPREQLGRLRAPKFDPVIYPQALVILKSLHFKTCCPTQGCNVLCARESCIYRAHVHASCLVCSRVAQGKGASREGISDYMVTRLINITTGGSGPPRLLGVCVYTSIIP